MKLEPNSRDGKLVTVSRGTLRALVAAADNWESEYGGSGYDPSGWVERAIGDAKAALRKRGGVTP